MVTFLANTGLLLPRARSFFQSQLDERYPVAWEVGSGFVRALASWWDDDAEKGSRARLDEEFGSPELACEKAAVVEDEGGG